MLLRAVCLVRAMEVTSISNNLEIMTGSWRAKGGGEIDSKQILLIPTCISTGLQCKVFCLFSQDLQTGGLSGRMWALSIETNVGTSNCQQMARNMPTKSTDVCSEGAAPNTNAQRPRRPVTSSTSPPSPSIGSPNPHHIRPRPH